MSVEGLRAAQIAALEWSTGVTKFWRQFLSEIASLAKETESLEGISLDWSLPDSHLTDLELSPEPGIWKFPPSYMSGHEWPIRIIVSVAGLPKSVTIHTIGFKATQAEGERIHFEIKNKNGAYSSLLADFALPLRMVSQAEQFESLFLWTSAGGNRKIKRLLTQWLLESQPDSEFILPPRPLPPQPNSVPENALGNRIIDSQLVGFFVTALGIAGVVVGVIILFTLLIAWLSAVL